MDFDEVLVKQNPGICRCCLAEGYFRDLRIAYQHNDQTEIYEKMLMDSLNISITHHADGPNGANPLICEVCIARLRDACGFKKQVLDSEKRFIDMLHRGDFGSAVMLQDEIKTESAADLHEEGSNHCDFDMSDEDCQPLAALKLRPQPKPERSEAKRPAPAQGRRGRGTPRKLDAQADKQPSKRRAKERDSAAVSYDSTPTRRRQRNLATLFTHTSIIPFKWRGNYLCFYCGNAIEQYAELRKHTLAHGPCDYTHYAIRLVRSGDAEVKIDVSDVTCEVCSEPFKNLAEILMHLSCKHNLEYDSEVTLNLTQYRLADLTCIQCGEAASSFRSLVGHVNKHHPVCPCVCERCSKTFSKRKDLVVHMNSFHRRGGYNCDECGLNFESSSKLRSHRDSSHPHVCDVCSESFTSVEARRLHMNRAHVTDGVARCEFCDSTWNTKHAYLQHLRKCKLRKQRVSVVPDKLTLKENEGKYKEVKSVRQNIAYILNMSNAVPFKFFMSSFRCFYCPNNFSEPAELRAHTTTQHPVCDVTHSSMRMRARRDNDVKIDIANLTCKLCSEGVPHLDALIEHLVTKHQAKYDKSVNVKVIPFKLFRDKYPCLLCEDGEQFKFFVNLLKHVNEAHSNNEVLCMFCGEAFRSKNNLRSHIRKHHAPPKLECAECELAFHTGHNLATHAARVHGRKVFQCNKCHEKFSTPYLKRRHMIREHNVGSKCPQCDRMFTGNAIMLAHVRRTHLKEKTVECPVCHVKMFDVHMMKMHVVRHEGERNFHCDVCGKKFMWKKNLRNHMSVHESDALVGRLPASITCIRIPIKKELKSEDDGDQPVRPDKVKQIIFKPSTVRDSSNKPTKGKIMYRTPDTDKAKKVCLKIASNIDLKNINEPSTPNLTTLNEIQKQISNIQTILLNTNSTPIGAKNSARSKNFSCVYCDTVFITPRELKDHCLTHADSEKLGFQKHAVLSCMVTRLDITGLKCTVCDTEIEDLDEMTDHLVTAHDKKIYPTATSRIVPFKFKGDDMCCCLCDLDCGTFKTLCTHMNMHFKNFCCNVCDAGFVSESKLQIHERIHKETGDFPCPDCDRKFDTAVKMRRHQRVIHVLQGKTHACSYCGERFSYHALYTRHLHEKHGLQMPVYKCRACDAEFDAKWKLSRHIKKEHLLEKKHESSL